MEQTKIFLTYLDDEGNYQMESVWATKHGNYYRIDNIPFFAPNIALGDFVSIDNEEGILHFDKLIKPSGHSTIQIILFDENEIFEIGKELENLGCAWEGSHIKRLISVDVPSNINYSKVKNYLEKGENEKRWSYKEACLAHR